MEKIHPTILSRLFKNWCGEHHDSILQIPNSGSKRRYYRLQSRDHKAIGAYNPNKKENKAFLKMTNFFLQENIPVPEIFAVHDSFTYYLQQDLGDTTLFSLITKYREEPEMVPVIKQYLREAIRELARIQIIAGRRMDFSMCHPYRRFNKSAILFDLEYFREHFLSQHKVHYHKRRLNKEFKQLAAFIGQAESHFFLYRDFQSRNIMLQDEHIFFIDYQGGRQGPLQYDLSSLLFQARANLPQQLREEMLDYYLRVARMLTPIDKVEFKSYFLEKGNNKVKIKPMDNVDIELSDIYL